MFARNLSLPCSANLILSAFTVSAAASAQPGDTVLLSPACASFDAFPNFAVRGQRFREIVNGLH